MLMVYRMTKITGNFEFYNLILQIFYYILDRSH